MFTCNICNRSFEKKRSLTSHKNHHNYEYKQKALKGSKALRTKKAEETRKKQYEDKKRKKWKQSNCITCGTELIYPQTKTCSDICYKQYRSNANRRIMTDKRKNNISNGMQNFLKKNGYSGVSLKCIICDTDFIGTKHQKCCDLKCEAIYKEQKHNTKRKKLSISLKTSFQEGRHKGNLYRNRKNKSYLERSFEEYLKSNFKNLKYTFNEVVKVFDTQGKYIKCFYIDFYLPKQNIGIELDGNQHKNTIEYDISRDQQIKDLRGIEIIRITYEEYFNKSKKDLIDSILRKELSL